jgi:hypothetical protein
MKFTELKVVELLLDKHFIHNKNIILSKYDTICKKKLYYFK